MSTHDIAADHLVSDQDDHIHHAWDNSLDPVLTVEPGEIVRFECRDATDGQVSVDSTAESILELDFGLIHPLTGPVAIEGVAAGDVLQVDLLDFQHDGWGYTGFFPGEMGLGLLPERFPDPGLHVWELEDDVGHFVNGIEVPLAPFPGVIGVAPAEEGEHDTLPPRSVGGNIDIKHLTAGSTLYLPIAVDGGLFSIGDCHAAQGDGEVCVTGVEAPMAVTVQFDVRSDMAIDQPQFETNHPFTPTGTDEPMYGTAGIDDNLMEATRKAVEYMIDHLHDVRGLTRSEAYILCSAAIDLKINEVVDAPNWVVSAYLPESIFPE